ncbi:hypothetical protein [Aquirufa rosea]|uniref:Glycosyltransferase RgtA/B/C/D-like domain-containing protein n=1 Tax=Aquirufa rosea TaxID=2509241 RepID=A0A4Q1BX19_9BACT|nr:hypothetical protein [Aquirufa rosea]RXK46543.1 hypothetical protein ESB04_12015 [Aquirufa rosea]
MLSVKELGLKWLFALSIISLIIFWFLFSLDVPWYDDVMVLAFCRNMDIQGITLDTLRQLFVNYNEHIIATTKLLFLLNSKLFGYINLSYLALQGILIYLAFVLLFIKHSTQHIYQNFIAIFLLCSLIYDEGYLWAMTSIQNFASLLLILLSIIFLNKNRVGWSFFFIFWALISSAQTLLFLPIWCLILCYYTRKLDLKILLLWGLVLFFYFSQFEDTGIRPEISSILSSFTKEKILNIIQNYAPPFGTLGTRFSIIYFVFEFSLLLFTFYRLIIDYWKKDLSHTKIILGALLIWSTLLLFLTFIVRSKLESRYLLYPAIKTACLYLYFLEMKYHKNIAKGMLILSLSFYALSMFPSLIKAKNTLVAMSALKFNMLNHQVNYFFSTDDVDARQVKPYYRDLAANELVDIPHRLNGRVFKHLLLFNQISNEQMRSSQFDRKEVLLKNLDSTQMKLISKQVVVDSLSPLVVYQQTLKSSNMWDVPMILLKSGQNMFLFPAKTSVPSLPGWINTKAWECQVEIYKNTLPYGQYQMFEIHKPLFN